MNRTGLLIALGTATASGLIFGLYPELDLKFSALFFDREKSMWLSFGFPDMHRRTAVSWLIALIAVPAFLALACKLLLPRRPMLLSGRAVLLLILTLALAPGLLANVILKDNSGRPRPGLVTEFGGPAQFVPWWNLEGPCEKNCSFVAGEPAGAFWTMAPAALAPPAWRMLAYGAAIGFGAVVGVMRIAGGGHFASDVIFAGILTFLVIWAVHGFLYRWRHTRITDEAVERTIERIAMPGHDAMVWIIGRMTGPAPRNKNRRET
jgi:membrane-associated PAP2 superfamily phosphatase